MSKSGLLVADLHIKDKDGVTTNSYLACYPVKLLKDTDGKWDEKYLGADVSKFFGVAVAKGLVERDALLVTDILAHVNNTVINDTIKELKNQGVKPISPEALITEKMMKGTPRFR